MQRASTERKRRFSLSISYSPARRPAWAEDLIALSPDLDLNTTRTVYVSSHDTASEPAARHLSCATTPQANQPHVDHRALGSCVVGRVGRQSHDGKPGRANDGGRPVKEGNVNTRLDTWRELGPLLFYLAGAQKHSPSCVFRFSRLARILLRRLKYKGVGRNQYQATSC